MKKLNKSELMSTNGGAAVAKINPDCCIGDVKDGDTILIRCLAHELHDPDCDLTNWPF